MFGVGFYQIIKGNGAVPGIVYIGGDRGCSVGGADGSSNKEGASGVVFLNVFNGLAGESSSFDIEFAYMCFKFIICLGDGG